MQINKQIYVAASGRAGFHITNDYDCDVYLVDCGGPLVLIDAGVGLESRRIEEQIRFHGFDPRQIKYILLTHGHADHSGGAFFMKELTGGKVLAHPDCARYVSGGDEEAIALTEAVRAGVYPRDYVFHACPTDSIKDGESLVVGNTSFTAIHAPGHCSGHHAYLMEGPCGKMLFAGDSIFIGGKISLQVIWDCDIIKYARTASRLAEIEFEGLLPSHYGIDLRDGVRHIRAAKAVFDGLGIPEQAGK